MCVTFTRAGIAAACVVLLGATVSAELAVYREFQLGTSVAVVTAVTRTDERDLKTIHTRPALLQQLEWRPRYTRGAPVAGRESIRDLTFSFVDDQLFKMTVTYERDRTNGLTNDDLIAALTTLYGAPVLPAGQGAPRPRAGALDGATVIAEWRDEATQIALQHDRYNEGFVLVITSRALDTVARKAQATAVVLDTHEAPAREAALAQKRADDARQAEEQARAANKKVFRP